MCAVPCNFIFYERVHKPYFYFWQHLLWKNLLSPSSPNTSKSLQSFISASSISFCFFILTNYTYLNQFNATNNTGSCITYIQNNECENKASCWSRCIICVWCWAELKLPACTISEKIKFGTIPDMKHSVTLLVFSPTCEQTRHNQNCYILYSKWHYIVKP
jgi:hypothetical protein